MTRMVINHEMSVFKNKNYKTETKFPASSKCGIAQQIKSTPLFFKPVIGFSNIISLCILFCSILLVFSCKSKPAAVRVFEKLKASRTNIQFSNTNTATDSVNILDYLYFYNGAGLASADFNNDGLEDLYFVSNQSSNKLYLNKGNLEFEDITNKAGVTGEGNWKNGVTIVDINGDGYQDIYLSVVSKYKTFRGKNQLYINNGDQTFTEKAEEWGVDFEGLSTHAAFFDYDKDSDLDLFILTHSVHSNNTYGDSTLRFKHNEIAGDHLYRNDGNRFTDVTKGSGIYTAPIGYGLGVSIADMNNDGWDDIYVSNDFFEQDYYYINQQNGTFKEKLKDAFGHTSLFSMGNTISDINKDGLLDVITTDMLPEDIKVLKSTINDEPLDIYNLEVKSGYYYQYSKNSLQLNVANGKKFVDVALYSGISATDWTWSPLVQDFDMDGSKDIFFSNGIKKRLNDLDYLKYLGDPNVKREFNNRNFDQDKINRMPDGKVHNYLYHGDSLLRFTDVSADNDMQRPSSSAGAIFVDLDNDGDPEIVTNNMDEPAFIYNNLTINPWKETKPDFVKYSLKYEGKNRDGIGTKLFLRSAKNTDHQEIQTSNAFQSGQNIKPLFTFLPGDKPVELLIVWPDNSTQIITKFNLQKTNYITYEKSKVEKTEDLQKLISNFLADKKRFEYQAIGAELLADVKTSTTPDFNYYSLLPHSYLAHTPAIAVADINNDGQDDIYVGGINGEEKYVLTANKNGTYKKINVPAFNQFKSYFDSKASWMDIDKDGDMDLIVISTSHPFIEPEKMMQHRLFINKGDYEFVYKELPPVNTPVSEMAIIDLNNDGLKDIFLAAGVSFRNYTKNNPSIILVNRGNGNFEAAPKELMPEMINIPFIKSATVADMDNNGKDDLILAAEWQPLHFFLNDGKTFKNWVSPATGKLKGWWQSVLLTDLNNDGKTDLIAGNWGLNNKFNVSEKQPMYAYNSDLDDNNKNDVIISYPFKGKYYPFRPKNDLEQELPYLKKEWLSYQKMADKTTGEIFKDRIPDDERLEVNTFESIFVSDIMHSTTSIKLPVMFQQAPVMSIMQSIEKNKKNEVIINGNFWGVIPYEGKYDGIGLATLRYDKAKKGFSIPGYWINPVFNFQEITYMQPIKRGNLTEWIIMTYDGKLLKLSAGTVSPSLKDKVIKPIVKK